MSKKEQHKNTAETVEQVEEQSVPVEETEQVIDEQQSVEENVPLVDEEKEALKAEVAKYKDLYIRGQADMENLRRRTQMEIEKTSKFAVTNFAKDLLSVADNLERAMKSFPAVEEADEQTKNIIVGLEMTQKEMMSALNKNGITPIESLNQVFDPNKHKVVQELEDPSKPTGTIIQEWQRGYMIGGDRVLREAIVVVTKGGASHVEVEA